MTSWWSCTGPVYLYRQPTWSPRAQNFEGHWGEPLPSCPPPNTSYPRTWPEIGTGWRCCFTPGHFLSWGAPSIPMLLRDPKECRKKKGCALCLAVSLMGRWPGMEHPSFLCCLEAVGSMWRRKAVESCQTASLHWLLTQRGSSAGPLSILHGKEGL